MDKRPFGDRRANGYRAHVWNSAAMVTFEATQTWGPTPALALCIAALKARARLSTTKEGE